MGDQELRILVPLVTATLLPLFGCFVVVILTRRLMFKGAGWFTTGLMAVSFLLSAWALLQWLGAEKHPTIVWNLPWIPIPGSPAGFLYLGAVVDSLTVAMMTMVTLVSLLVHVYSIGYMAGDKRFNWFFAYLSLFTFSMLGIVMANSLLEMFVFWELVGLTSYLLIGFWFERRGPQLACKKAFVMNRIGDAGFLIGFGILFFKLGGNVLLPAAEGVLVAGEQVTSMLGAIEGLLAKESAAAGLTGASVYSLANPPIWLTAAGIGLFFGAIGKSAQFPLQTWLPDAMEGPTPVSSIVHSATMVAAGVYLTGRIYPILTPSAHLFVATIGLITLVMAACMALVMTDIKRVLAYSTLSQLGYMILGMGTGAYIFALYHLITHAFFKCCLFQCSGSVIHAAHHQQDMRYYGGLGRKLPWTMVAYGICTLAIAGASIPYTAIGISGFYSKDGIIAGAWNYSDAMSGYGLLGGLFFWGPVIIAWVTPFYMARSFALTFLGKPRDQHLYDHAREAPATMVVPQLVLAAMALLSVPWLMPFWRKLIEATAAPTAQGLAEIKIGEHHIHAPLLYGFVWILMIGLGLFMYRDGFRISSKIVALPVMGTLYRWAYNKFYFDGLYDIFTVNFTKFIAVLSGAFDKYLVDGLVNLCGWGARFASGLAGHFDNRVIDGAANGTAATAWGGGQLLRNAQPGRIRVYVLLMFATVVLVSLVVVVTVNMARG